MGDTRPGVNRGLGKTVHKTFHFTRERIICITGEHMRGIGKLHVLRLWYQLQEFIDDRTGHDVAARAGEQQHRHVYQRSGSLQARLMAIPVACNRSQHRPVPMPVQTTVLPLAQQRAQLLLGLALAPLWLIRRDALGRLCIIGKAVQTVLHEIQDALHAGRFPTRRDIHQYQGCERTRSNFTGQQHGQQTSHRGSHQDRWLPLRARQAQQIVGKLLKMIVTVDHATTFAMPATVKGHAAATATCQRDGRRTPCPARLPKAVRKKHDGTAAVMPSFRRQTNVGDRKLFCRGGRRWHDHTREYGSPAICQSTGSTQAVHYKPATARYHARMNVSSKPERTRLTSDDWELAALAAIAEQGVGSLSVEALARQLGVTKGSFYWHFRTREALLGAALGRWERYGEAEIIRPIEQMPDPSKRLPELFRRVAHELQTHRVYAALLKALDHAQVVPVIARVSQRRMDFLTAIYRESGLKPAQALNRARLTYSAYVGFLQLNFTPGLPRLTHEDYDDYVEHMIAVLVPN